jgi:hypothetical protein
VAGVVPGLLTSPINVTSPMLITVTVAKKLTKRWRLTPPPLLYDLESYHPKHDVSWAQRAAPLRFFVRTRR